MIRYGGVAYASGFWPHLIWVQEGAALTIRDCVIESVYDRAIVADQVNTELIVVDSVISDVNTGVYCAASTVGVSGSAIDDFWTTAVHVAGSCLANVVGSNFTDAERDLRIRNDTVTVVNGENNWWGDARGPSGFGPGTGVQVSDKVDYDPWALRPLLPPGDLITSTPNLAAEVDVAYQYDADGCASASGAGAITWSTLRGPARFGIESNTGCVTWLPKTLGPVIISIAAADDVGVDIETFQVIVSPAGGDATPPQVVSFDSVATGRAPGTWDTLLTVGFSENVQVSAVDVALLDGSGFVVPFKSFGYHLPTFILTIIAFGLNDSETNTLVLADTITDDALNPLDGEFFNVFPSGNGLAGGDFAAEFIRPLAGDFNGDRLGTLADYKDFQDCLTGPDGGSPPPSCRHGDLDLDDDIDLYDYGMFQRAFGKP